MPLPSWLMPFGQNAPERTKGPTGYSNRQCPNCGTRLAYGFSGSSTAADKEVLICEKLGCKLQGQSQDRYTPKSDAPKEESKVSITFSSKVSGTEPVVPKSETKWFSKLSSFDKASELAKELDKQYPGTFATTEEIAKSRGLIIVPRRGLRGIHNQYIGYCEKCAKNRPSMGLKCIRCSTPLAAPHK